MAGYYGPMSSIANLLGTFAGSEGAPWLKEQFNSMSDTGDSGALGTIGAVGLPALVSGGLGYMTGGKYGLMNALSPALMGALSLSAQDGEKDKGLPQLQQGDAPASNLNAAVQKNDPDQADSTPQPAPTAKPNPAAGSAAPAAANAQGVAGGKGMGGFGDMLSTPIGRFIASQMIASMTSGAAQGASGQAAANKLSNQLRTAGDAQTAQRVGYLGGLYNGRAMGGYINNTPVTDLSPQARIKSAQVNPAASPMGHEVIDPSALTMAHGGPVHGKGDGMSDDVQATVDGKEPIRLARGEFVVPKHIAEKHGDKLKSMMAAVRKAAHPHPGKQIKQDAGKREFIRHMSGGKVKA